MTTPASFESSRRSELFFAVQQAFPDRVCTTQSIYEGDSKLKADLVAAAAHGYAVDHLDRDIASDLYRDITLYLHFEEEGEKRILQFPSAEDLPRPPPGHETGPEYGQKIAAKLIAELKRRRINRRQFFLTLKLAHQGNFASGWHYLSAQSRRAGFTEAMQAGKSGKELHLFVDKEGNVRLESSMQYKINKISDRDREVIKTVSLKSFFDLQAETIRFEEEREVLIDSKDPPSLPLFSKKEIGILEFASVKGFVRDCSLPLHLYEAIKTELGAQATFAQLCLAKFICACVFFFVSTARIIGRAVGSLLLLFFLYLPYLLHRRSHPIEWAVEHVVSKTKKGTAEEVTRAYQHVAKVMIQEAQKSGMLLTSAMRAKDALIKKLGSEHVQKLHDAFARGFAQEHLENPHSFLFSNLERLLSEEELGSYFSGFKENFWDKVEEELPKYFRKLCSELEGFEKDYIPAEKLKKLEWIVNFAEKQGVPLDTKALLIAGPLLAKHRHLEHVAHSCENLLQGLSSSKGPLQVQFAAVRNTLLKEFAKQVEQGWLREEEIDLIFEERFFHCLAEAQLRGRVSFMDLRLFFKIEEHKPFYPLFCKAMKQCSSLLEELHKEYRHKRVQIVLRQATPSEESTQAELERVDLCAEKLKAWRMAIEKPLEELIQGFEDLLKTDKLPVSN